MEDEIAGEGEEYDNKKRILSLIFRHIDLDELVIPEEKTAAVRAALGDITVFRTSMNELVKMLLVDRRE